MSDARKVEVVWRRAARTLDLALGALAAVLAVSIAFAGWHDVSQGYDVWYYHLPFAARLAGIMDADAYAFSAENQTRFDGFPLLAEALQGLVWRLTGRVEATNLVPVASVFGLGWLLWRLFAVPPHLSLLALLAIPLVHIHATAGYVDLPGNACATMLLLATYRVIVENRAPSLRMLCACAALAAAAVNTKFQLVPIVALAAMALSYWSLRDLVGVRSASPEARSALRKRAIVLALAVPVVFATPIKNAVVHHNPAWPVELRLFGRTLPHAETAYEQSPPHLTDAPRAIRFARSALEIDNVPIATHRRWSLDQWAPADHPSCRMGGYFGAYVAANLAALALAVVRRRDRETVVAAAVFGVVTVVAAVVPQSHELRYYMHWMLLLVSLNLVLWAPRARALVGVVATGALAVVTWSTSAAYVYPSGITFAELLARRVDPHVLEGAAPNERLCIAREPFTFLYAPAFHPERTYSVQEATNEADCRGARLVR